MEKKKNKHNPISLSSKDEKEFKRWYKDVSEYKGLNPDPDDKGQYYDYRGFWKENPDIAERMLTDDKEAHFTDLYKLPGHPTFSNESKYGGKELGGKWVTGEDSKSYYEPSVFTRSYLDRTMNYLRGTGEGVLVDGEYVMPPKVPLRFDDGGTVREKQDHIYKRLTEEYDIEPMQAIAIVANLTHESGLVEDILGDSGASYGIQQWRDERRKGLEKYAKSKGHESPTLDDQVDYLMDEYSGGKAFQFSKQGRNLYKDKKVKDATFDYYQFSKSDFDNAASLHDAVIAWNQGVGRPNKEFAMNEERYRIAKEMASRYGTVSPEGENFYSDMGYMDPDNPPAEKQEEVVDTDRLEDISNIEEKVDATPVNAAENYYEAFGKQIISGLFAEAKNNMPIGGGSEGNTEVSEDMQRDKIAIERAIAEEKEKAKKQELLKVFLPNIQLAVKGVTQVGK